MKTTKSFFFVCSLLILSLGCSEDEMPGSVILEFDHKVDRSDLVFDQIQYLSPAGHQFSVVRLKYYVSDFQLTGSSEFQVSDPTVHYRDALEEETRSVTLEKVPPGNYHTLSFTFGLNDDINKKGLLPNSTTNINMEWPIPGDEGYHFMKFEGKYNVGGSGEIKNFNLHSGATSGNQNYFRVSLPISQMKIDGGIHRIHIEMDILEWLQNPTIYDFETFGPMIMANQDAQSILKANGASVFQIGSIE